jgi:RecA/RadA recombinase
MMPELCAIFFVLSGFRSSTILKRKTKTCFLFKTKVRKHESQKARKQERMRMKTIVFASQKGGAGKTTLAAHLAVAAVKAGDGPCVLIDTDPQASLTDWWNGREDETPAFAPSR